MYNISTKDKVEIIRIFLKHKCVVNMTTLIKEYSYKNFKEYKRQKILKILKILDKELNRTIQIKIYKRADSKYELRFL